MRYGIALGLLLLLTQLAPAQETILTGGLFPELALSHKLEGGWQLTAKVESQHFSYRSTEAQEQRWGYQHYRTDLQGFLERKLSPRWKVAVGYQFRLAGGDAPNSHRSIQQLTYVHGIRLQWGHRLRSDQTFEPGSANEYRLRYRLSVEVPLRGQTLNYGETYLLFSNELIASTQDQTQELENRLVGALGWQREQAKYQLGLEWRSDKYLNPGFRHRLWVKLGGYFSI